MYNVYYNPEKFGLVIIATIDYSSGSYEFDTRVVWKDKQGNFFTARDSGCSCPTPFEDYSLENIDRLNLDELQQEVSNETSGEYNEVSPEEAQSFMRNVREAVNATGKPFSYISHTN